MQSKFLKYKDWYRDCGDKIRQEYGRYAGLFIGLLAATSPRKQVSANFRLANRIFHRHIGGLPIEYDRLLPAARSNVKRALLNEPLSGNKVRAFAENLKGNFDAVTIDIWILRYYGIGVKSLSNGGYKNLSRLIAIEARQYQLKPAEYQAVIWSEIRAKYGLKPSSYLLAEEFSQKFFEFYWE